MAFLYSGKELNLVKNFETKEGGLTSSVTVFTKKVVLFQSGIVLSRGQRANITMATRFSP